MKLTLAKNLLQKEKKLPISLEQFFNLQPPYLRSEVGIRYFINSVAIATAIC